jgi:hypothetical protein
LAFKLIASFHLAISTWQQAIVFSNKWYTALLSPLSSIKSFTKIAVIFSALFFLITTMSFYDHEISKVIWNGKIPVKINIDAKELGTNHSPLFVKHYFQT